MGEKRLAFRDWIKSRETKKLGILTSLFFMATAVFWILKPIRKSLLIGYFKDNPLNLFDTFLGGAQTEQLAKLSIVLVALVVALSFPRLIKRYPMRQIFMFVSLVAAIGLFVSVLLISRVDAASVWGFYVFGDFINSLIVTLLWLLLHNSVNTEQAKKIYSAIVIGSVAGGMFGAFFLYQSVSILGRDLIVALCIAPMLIIGSFGYYIACRITDSQTNCEVAFNDHDRERSQKDKLFSFWTSQHEKPRTTKYWLGIALLVGLYEISSGIIDFQLSVAVESVQATAYERDIYFGIIGQAQSFVALIVQVFVTGWVIKRWGVGIALLILPFATLFGSVGFLLIPTLASAMFLSVSDNALNYSVNQSAKETLYVPTRSDERVAAKSIIDLFVQRFAKGFAVTLNLILVTQVSLRNVRWLSLLAITLMVLWIFIARFTSREFEHLAIKEI